MFGFQGLAPYVIEVDASLLISEKGDISARFEAEHDILITQRLIAQPKLEVSAALQEVEELGIGSGLNDIELGFRVRYEITRKFSPMSASPGAAASATRRISPAPRVKMSIISHS